MTDAVMFAKAFPGLLNLEAAISHQHLVAIYHQKFRRLSFDSKNGLFTGLPTFPAHFVSAEVKHLSEFGYEDALNWLNGAGNVRAKR